MRGDESRRLVRPKMKDIEERDMAVIAKKQYDIVQPKYDGIWGRLETGADGWEIYSRTGLYKTGGLGNFPECVLHGEFMFGSQWSKHPDRQGKIYLFDAEVIHGGDIRGLDYKWRLEKLHQMVVLLPDVMQEEWVVVETRPAPTTQIELDALWDEWVIGDDMEGIMFKWDDVTWEEQQIHGFGRLKTRPTMDYICMGFRPGGKGTKYEHLVASVLGGLYIGGELEQVAKIGGLTEDQRERFAANPDKYIGRVFEASGRKVFKSGALRHPSFERWRDDKPATDCVLPTL